MPKPLLPLTDETGEVRELRAQDVAAFRPAHEGLPAELRKVLGVRGPQRRPTKIATTLRLSPDVMEAFRNSGPGWQTRIDAALKDWLRTHRPA